MWRPNRKKDWINPEVVGALARVEHWKLLPRARAVEDPMYVGAVNGVGVFESVELLDR